MPSKTRPPPTPRPSERATVRPSEEHIRLALRAAAVLMAPVVRWLLRHGVSYGAFADELKVVFVNVAREELERGGSKTTHSALSVLSGVHRKDVKTIDESVETRTTTTQSVPLASQVFTRWITDAAYRDRTGKPRPLPRTGPRRSFEALCIGISTDVHPRTVLDELVRLGLVRIDDETVVPTAVAFIPSRKLDELTGLFAANIADHVAAGAHNLTMPGPKFLEQSVWANGLTELSAEQLHQVSREAWERAFETVAASARERVAADYDGDGTHRFRFGAYFFSEPVDEPDPADTTSRPARHATAERNAASPGSPGNGKTRRRT